VAVFERDASAIRGEGKYRGPIQVQSNALAALEAVDQGVAAAVMQAGCITVRITVAGAKSHPDALRP
jgi:zeaxanthin epoxidase